MQLILNYTPILQLEIGIISMENTVFTALISIRNSALLNEVTYVS